MHDIFEDIADMQNYIQPLYINGLHGRMLRIPSRSKKRQSEILLIYGHHSSLERMYGVAEVFAEYGNLTMPDLPGFGGMDSFYSIGMKPTIDNLADYLATFVKLKYRRRRLKIVGLSLGFVIVTRMLQKYPDLAKKVDVLVSVAGFAHKSDFTYSRRRMFIYRSMCFVLGRRIPAFVFRSIALHPLLLKTVYTRSHNAKHKFDELDPKTRQQMVDFEVILWRTNDVRTHWNTAFAMLTIDNCKSQVALPVHHVAVKNDQYFVNAVVEQHMRVIFTDYYFYPVSMRAHVPSIIASRSEADPMVPKKLRTIFNS